MLARLRAPCRCKPYCSLHGFYPFYTIICKQLRDCYLVAPFLDECDLEFDVLSHQRGSVACFAYGRQGLISGTASQHIALRFLAVRTGIYEQPCGSCIAQCQASRGVCQARPTRLVSVSRTPADSHSQAGVVGWVYKKVVLPES